MTPLRAVRDAAGIPFRGPLCWTPNRDAIVSGLLALDVVILEPEESDMTGYEVGALCEFAIRRAARAGRRQASRGRALAMVMPLMSAPPEDHEVLEPEATNLWTRLLRWIRSH